MSDQILPTVASFDINALLEFSRLLNDLDDEGGVLNNLLLSLMGKLGLGRAAAAVPEEAGRFRVAHAKGAASELLGGVIAWNEEQRTLTQVAELEEDKQRDWISGGGIAQVMPVYFGDRVFALILLGHPLVADHMDAGTAASYALLVGAIAATALEGCRIRGSLRAVNRRLERRVHRLRSLFEASRVFGTLLDQDAILRLLGYTLMGEMAIAQFAVVLFDNGTCTTAVNRFPTALPEEELESIADQGTLIAPSPALEPLAHLAVHASIPMELQGKARGLLLVGKRLQFSIDEEDAEYLSSLANLAMSSLENERLLKEMIEKQRLEEDLKIAWEIQQQLLPGELPDLGDFEIAAATIPSRQVGGDCYDVIDLGEGRALISIADVSGKGTPAALLMANVQAALRALARLHLPLPELVSRINDVIYENTSPDKFITAFFGILDRNSGGLSYVNAGHNPPFLFTRSGIEELRAGGLILGILPGPLDYQTGTVELAPDSLLLCYTDGVTEALNPEREEYGEERLRALLAAEPGLPAGEALERVRQDILGFARGAQQSDDVTIIAIRRPPEQRP